MGGPASSEGADDAVAVVGAVAARVAGAVDAIVVVAAGFVAGCVEAISFTGGACSGLVRIGDAFSSSGDQFDSLKIHAPPRFTAGQFSSFHPTASAVLSTQTGRRGVGSGSVGSSTSVCP